MHAMPTLEPGTSRQAGALMLLFPEFSIPWTMVAADVIVRAKLVDVRPAVEQNKTEPPYFAAAKDFVFEPLEFLKGSGPDQLRVRVAYIHPPGGSEERALAVAEYVLATNPGSGRFGDREAILLLTKYMSNSEVEKNQIAGRPRRDRSEVASHDPSLFAFAHAHTWGYNPSVYEYQVTDKSNKAWLPAAGGDGEDTMYFTDHEPTWFNLVETEINESTMYLYNDVEWSPGTPTVVPVLPCSKLSNFVAHEAGHAFGVGMKLGNGHTTLQGTLLREETFILCEPQAYDVAAIMALYQSR